MARRRQRNLTPLAQGPAAVASRGLSFSDSSDYAGREQVDSLPPQGVVPRRLSRLENLGDRLASGDPLDFRRGMGRTFRPMSLGPGPDEILRRPAPFAGVRQLSRSAAGAPFGRAVFVDQRYSASRLLQAGLPSRPIAQLDRRTRVCVLRRVRRGVLFALRVAGRSGGSPGRNNRYRHSVDSAFSCG